MDDEYEYACQLVLDGEKAVGLSRDDWVSREQAEQLVVQETEDNIRYESEFGENGCTFRLVRRKKAGAVEVLGDDA